MNKSVQQLQERYEEAIKQYNFFDFNFWNDPLDIERFYPAPGKFEAIEQIRKVCTAGVLMTNGASKTVDPGIGNDRLVELLNPADNVFGALIVTPDPQFSGPAFEEYIEKMTKAGVVALRLYPKRFYHSLSDTVCGEFYEILESYNMPLILSHVETSWDGIESLCKRHPNMKIVIDGGDAKILYHNRDYMAMLKAYDNLHVDTHGLVVYDEIEDLCKIVGAEKLVFGSYAVYNEPAISVTSIAFAHISDEEKKLIAHGNALRLLDGAGKRK